MILKYNFKIDSQEVVVNLPRTKSIEEVFKVFIELSFIHPL